MGLSRPASSLTSLRTAPLSRSRPWARGRGGNVDRQKRLSEASAPAAMMSGDGPAHAAMEDNWSCRLYTAIAPRFVRHSGRVEERNRLPAKTPERTIGIFLILANPLAPNSRYQED